MTGPLCLSRSGPDAMVARMEQGSRIRHPWLFSLAADVAAVAAAYYTTLAIRFHSGWGAGLFTRLNQMLGVRETGELGEVLEWFYSASAFRIIVISAVVLCSFYAMRDLYLGNRVLRQRFVTWNIVVANAWALILFFLYFYLSRNTFHPRSFFLTFLFLNASYCIVLRGGMRRFRRWLRDRFGVGRCPALVVGGGQEANRIVELLRAEEPQGVHLAFHWTPESGLPFAEVLGRLESLSREHSASMVIVSLPDLSLGQIMQILDVTDNLDLSAKVLSPHLERLVTHARQPADLIQGVPLLHFESPSQVAGTVMWRRCLCVAISAISGVVLLPFLLVIGLTIRLTSHGPALFVQERIGVNRRPFRMFKFRTMHNRAEELLAQMEEFNESGGGLFKMRRDPRVTPVGRFLRRFSLDELPQLINVVRGDMVLVGPRPLPRRDFENYYEEWHYGRHNGMPGLTCLWQVSGRSDLSFHDMCILDVYYLRNQGWLLDMKILLKTVWVVMFAKGAY